MVTGDHEQRLENTAKKLRYGQSIGAKTRKPQEFEAMQLVAKNRGWGSGQKVSKTPRKLQMTVVKPP
jgi:hypothetical protein